MARSYRPLLWWMIIATSMGVGAYFAYDHGYIQSMWESSWMSAVIGGLLLVGTLVCGNGCVQFRRITKNLDDNPKRETSGREVQMKKLKKLGKLSDIGLVIAEVCMALGFLGTLGGFKIILDDGMNMDATDVQAVQRAIAYMNQGLAVAIWTTIAGIVASILVIVQFAVLRYSVDLECDD